MSTHNICFHGKLEKIILELSSNTPPYQVSCGYKTVQRWIPKMYRVLLKNDHLWSFSNIIYTFLFGYNTVV